MAATFDFITDLEFLLVNACTGMEYNVIYVNVIVLQAFSNDEITKGKSLQNKLLTFHPGL